MIKSSALRVAPAADGVSIWSSEIFGDAEASRVREFLSRAFSVREVEGVELRRAAAFGHIRFGAAANPAQIWRKLSRALSSREDAPTSAVKDAPARRIDAGLVYLDSPGVTPVRVSRIGAALSTWRVRHQSENTLRLSHPVLRNRRDVVFRLEEELAAIFGVEDFRASAITAGVSIRFDNNALSAERLALELEKAWPRLVDGLDGPPSQKRLIAAAGLLGLAFTGQYVVPALRPVAVAGVALYSAPNVVNALKQLTRGEVGLSALYASGLAFMLLSGMPFNSAAIAVLMQFWPHLARRKIVRSQRRLFAAQRRRPAWARTRSKPGHDEQEVNVDELRKGDLVIVRRGEIVPVDGVVTDGYAAVSVEALFGSDEVEDRSTGDAITAGALVRDGSLTIRVERAGAQTAASYVNSLLPHAEIAGLPSSQEAERIANRNAKPTLAVSVLSLLLSRNLRVSQALIRPDYATAPRLSAQLSAFHGVARGLDHGVLFRNPAALDRLADAEVYVIDDTAHLDHRRVEVATVQTATGVSAALVVGYVLAAQVESGSRSEQRHALAAFASSRKGATANAGSVSRSAGVTRYRDSLGSAIEIAAARHLKATNIEVPSHFQTVPACHVTTLKLEGSTRVTPPARRVETLSADPEPALRPLYVIRDGEVIGLVSFARSGETIGSEVVAALKARNEHARIVYISRSPDTETQALARTLGIEVSHGGLSPAAKLDLVRGLGTKTIWIGDGSAPDVRESIAASTVSISVAPLSRAREDAADVLLPHKGLDSLPAVIDLARAHAARLARDYRTVYAANLLGVAGAVGARFNSLHAGLLSNVSTGLIYARHAWDLDRLASAAEAKRASLKRTVS